MEEDPEGEFSGPFLSSGIPEFPEQVDGAPLLEEVK
jgi:hypothetical protein